MYCRVNYAKRYEELKFIGKDNVLPRSSVHKTQRIKDSSARIGLLLSKRCNSKVKILNLFLKEYLSEDMRKAWAKMYHARGLYWEIIVLKIS